MDFLDIHTHKASLETGITSIQSLSLTNDIFLEIPKKKPISIGLHPWYAILGELEIQMEHMSIIAMQTNVKLIGECGLDKLRGESMENQMVILEAQIHLAEKLEKPLILHCVKAFDELIAIKNRLNVKVPMIIHGFNKNEALGKQLLDNGFYLSFGSTVIKSNSSLTNLIKQLDFFFLETDDSTNSIEEIYQAVAEIRKCSVDELKVRIFANWKKLNPNP